jgi:GWxTD domain-containing protein
MRERSGRALVLAALVGLSFCSACRLVNLERNLGPVNADFLSKVRYIITRDERKIFLELPDSEKPRFIEEFWKRRDPDPSTEENEFKIEYFIRIEVATKLFRGEGLAGWITDRGRIYVIFGPPNERLTYLQPTGGIVSTGCQEVWYYGDFPVVFIDQTCTGTYKLATYDLGSLRDINSMFQPGANKAGVEVWNTLSEGRAFFDFEASLKITARDGGRIEGLLSLEVPYERIWYKSEGKKMWTTLQVGLELRDAKKAPVWQNKAGFDIKLDEGELDRMTGKKYIMDIAIKIQDEEKIGRLSQGGSFLYITLTNTTGNEVLKKTLEFK